MTALSALLSCLVTGRSAVAQAPAERPRVLLVRPASSPALPSFEALRSALEAMLRQDAEVVVEEAGLPRLDDEDPGGWGASVARSEGARAMLWMRRAGSSSQVDVWVVLLEGDGHAFVSLQIRESSPFDRGRAIALAVRPLLDPLFSPAPAERPARGAAAETSPAAASSSDEREAAALGARDATGEGVVGPRRPSDAALGLRLGLGPVLFGDGPAFGGRVMAELAFLDYGWLRLAGEMVPERATLEGVRPDRGHVSLSGGAEIAWEFLRARAGGVVGLGIASVRAQPLSLALTLGGVVAVAARLADELFIELPLRVDAAVARAEAAVFPEVEVSVSLLLGLAPAGW